MNRDAIVAIFDEARAANYDGWLNNVEAMHDALMLGIRLVLAPLPADARILSVGAGTGTEIITLARHFPGWTFTAVEPAAPMMARCRERLEAEGLLSRCRFHSGFLETLPASEPFDAATCLLVAHFFPDRQERRGFLRGIGERLRAGGLLVNHDLSRPSGAFGYEPVMEAWVRLMRLSGATTMERTQYEEGIREAVGLLTPEEMEAVLLESGFEDPGLFFRMMMVGAWVSRWSGAR